MNQLVPWGTDLQLFTQPIIEVVFQVFHAVEQSPASSDVVRVMVLRAVTSGL